MMIILIIIMTIKIPIKVIMLKGACYIVPVR